jgi:polysaccharide biosynthesis transport protein
VAVTSPSAGEGKSLISSNLAVAFAEVGRRTLLIDGDTRRGDAHRLLGRDRVPGLVDYLRDRSWARHHPVDRHENLDFIGCGSRGSSTPELLASTRLAHFIGTLKRSYDVIIVDCPPLAAGGDALILGRWSATWPRAPDGDPRTSTSRTPSSTRCSACRFGSWVRS